MTYRAIAEGKETKGRLRDYYAWEKRNTDLRKIYPPASEYQDFQLMKERILDGNG